MRLQLGGSEPYPLLHVDTTIIRLEGEKLLPCKLDAAREGFIWVGEGLSNGFLFIQRELQKWG